MEDQKPQESKQQAQFWLEYGRQLSDSIRYAEALSAIERAISLDETRVEAWYAKGTCLAMLARYDEALEAKEVSAVMDGADWCQMFTDRHRPDAVRILDFPHAAEHINYLLEALENATMHFRPKMLERSLHILKHRGPQPLVRMADRLGNNLAQQKGVYEHLDASRVNERR